MQRGQDAVEFGVRNALDLRCDLGLDRRDDAMQLGGPVRRSLEAQIAGSPILQPQIRPGPVPDQPEIARG
ncbi:hypothetical protein [Methylohalobius crimeensis]|uniref:hypothetical protein n=1 Tax=Methylohalobius crimeensis TaxID=244365 RepID=UPI0012694060|nr:hypothetical protein [Methylohalobius crimeensis]